MSFTLKQEDQILQRSQQMNLASHVGLTLLSRTVPKKKPFNQTIELLTANVVEAKGIPKMDIGTTGTVDPYGESPAFLPHLSVSFPHFLSLSSLSLIAHRENLTEICIQSVSLSLSPKP